MINNLQALRAFAALSVVLFHTFGQTAKHAGGDSLLADFFGGWGNNGVDIFFVISGFIMVYIQHSNPKGALDFLTNRAKKIVPLYWSVTLLFAALLLLLPAAFNTAVFDFRHTWTSLLFVSRLNGYVFPIVDLGWTLEYEMFFYLLFGLSLALPRLSTLAVVPLILLGCVLLSDINLIVLEFAFGMLAGWLFVQRRLQAWGWPLLLGGCAAMLVSLFFDIEAVPRVLRFGVPAFFIVLGACYVPQTGNRMLIMVGSASYSIYLLHALALPVFYKALKLARVPLHTTEADLISLGAVLFSAAVGILAYQLYEKPVARLLR
jgi:peptidoglycan/LPS O-acetylase OafA/YrhL